MARARRHKPTPRGRDDGAGFAGPGGSRVGSLGNLDHTFAFVETFILVGSVLGPVSTVGAGILCIRRLSERLRSRRPRHSAPDPTSG
jgi:hypothetical protein